jgi:acetyl coenzyme A synthetase (ADP forming)-like protein
MSDDAAPNYPSQWESDVVLADGGTVSVRPIRPDDGDALLRLHSRLSPEAIYLRYFSPHPRLSEQELKFLTEVDYRTRMAFVAVLGEEIVAVARYEGREGASDAEVAFLVEDSQQGRGIGTLLLEYLAAAARENGIHEFYAVTLYENQKMLGVFRETGFEVRRIVAGGEVHVRFPVAETEALACAIARREHKAEARSIGRLLAPRSIAVVGAGRARGGIGHELFRNLLLGGFAGPVFPVHAKAESVAGVRAYPSVLDISDEVDLAVVCVPAETVPAVVAQCAEKRVQGIVLITAGFAETGPEGAAIERDLVHLARRNGMRLVGPNCMGVVNTNPAVAMNATFAPVAPPMPGRVGFVSQSGALGIAILERSARMGLGISTFVSLGNKADVSSNDLLQFWEDDAETDVILLYIESFGNPGKFNRIARRVSRRKPILAVKAGRRTAATSSGGVTPQTITARLTSSDLAVDALFRQTGVQRVGTVEELFDVAQVLAHQPVPAGRRVAIVGNAAGPAVLAADACEAAGLEVPEFGAATQASLRQALPPGAGVGNPIDMMAGASPGEYEAALRLVLADPSVDAVIVIFTPPLVRRPGDVAQAIADAAGQAVKPIVANFLGVDGVPDALRPAAIPSFTFPEAAARALARAAAYGEWRQRPEGTVPRFEGIDGGAARAAVEEALAAHSEGTWLDPSAATAVLSAFCISSGSAEMSVEGVELVLGAVRDPTFGPLVVVAVGGDRAELVDDRAVGVAPLTDVDAAHLVRSLRAARLLTGPAAALEDLLLRVSQMAEQLPQIAEMDLNPVIVSPTGAMIAGARIRVAPHSRSSGRDLRRLR